MKVNINLYRVKQKEIKEFISQQPLSLLFLIKISTCYSLFKTCCLCSIGYVTPEQKHSDQAEEILIKARSERKRLARLHRLKTNREQVSQPELAQAA